MNSILTQQQKRINYSPQDQKDPTIFQEFHLNNEGRFDLAGWECFEQTESWTCSKRRSILLSTLFSTYSFFF